MCESLTPSNQEAIWRNGTAVIARKTRCQLNYDSASERKQLTLRNYKEKVIIEVYTHCRYFSSTIPDKIFGAK